MPGVVRHDRRRDRLDARRQILRRIGGQADLPFRRVELQEDGFDFEHRRLALLPRLTGGLEPAEDLAPDHRGVEERVGIGPEVARAGEGLAQ